ncbi:uncharacterized protein RAG0_01699 [Rhynchosporium agropyri]|uniref:Uncharacterized protein n=1 Tax=Rhynchosporium agropyri TaxID=914238 RepID=A0A1E1JXZ2_9HELO|nr:uncharacterized protein RAG0_01699 [Rhynchosporium agropyri]
MAKTSSYVRGSPSTSYLEASQVIIVYVITSEVNGHCRYISLDIRPDKLKILRGLLIPYQCKNQARRDIDQLLSFSKNLIHFTWLEIINSNNTCASSSLTNLEQPNTKKSPMKYKSLSESLLFVQGTFNDLRPTAFRTRSHALILYPQLAIEKKAKSTLYQLTERLDMAIFTHSTAKISVMDFTSMGIACPAYL